MISLVTEALNGSTFFLDFLVKTSLEVFYLVFGVFFSKYCSESMREWDMQTLDNYSAYDEVVKDSTFLSRGSFFDFPYSM